MDRGLRWDAAHGVAKSQARRNTRIHAHRHIQTEIGLQTQRTDFWLPEETGVMEGWMGVWSQLMPTIIYRMDKNT